MKTSIVGILNVTPDSFSDGDQYLDPDFAYKHANKMVKEGASVIDIGAESTRPGAKTIDPEEEWRRLGPILKKLRDSDLNAWISVDTRNPETATKALLEGVDWINDVSGLDSPQMIELLAKSEVNVVFMHNLGVPANKNIVIDENKDVVMVIKEWATKKIEALMENRINKTRLIFDPGIGFGKTAEQSLEIIKRINEFKELGVRLMIGHSRKSFIGLFIDKKAEDRDKETAEISSFLAHQSIEFLRVHNVRANLDAINNPSPKLGLDGGTE